MLTAYNSTLAQPALTQGAIATNVAHYGTVVDTGLYGNDFRSLMFVLSAQTITDGTHTVTVQETPFSYLVTLGTQSSGTFTLTWNGFTTTAIPYNAAAATVQAALVALTGGALNWVVTGSAGGPYTVTLPSSGIAPAGALTGSGASLTTPGNFGITSGSVGTFTVIDPVNGGTLGSKVQCGVGVVPAVAGPVLPVLAAANSNNLFAFGVHHTLRYVQLVITTAGATTGGLFSAVAVCDSASHGPVARA